jgi:probable rRNA maturation factor
MDRPTNVLAFPAELPDSLPEDLGPPLLGDIVLCRDLVFEEARAQGKPAMAHWAHLTVHGALHLIGYDHGNAEEAEIMESIERDTLSGLGYPDPYAATGEPS